MHELNAKDRKRYHDLFVKLDVNSDGKVDVNDLVALFEQNKVSDCQQSHLARAQKFIGRSKKDGTDNLNFHEFVQYMKDHESRLQLVFKKIDTDNNNQIGSEELLGYFKKLGVDITSTEAQRLVDKIDRNGSLMIEPDEWRQYFFLVPIDNLDELLYHWRYSALIDIAGESLTVPEDFPSSAKSKQTNLWSRNLIAGAIAGGISRTCTAPFDRLKTVMQVLGSRKQITIVGGFKHMLNEGGLTSLWRGNGINVIKIAPEAALKFTFYEEIKHKLIGVGENGPIRDATIGERFISGSIAGCLAQSTIYPLEVLKTRLVLRKTGEYSSVFDCANKIVKNEGIRAFYKGYLPNVLGIIPYAGTDLAVYETLKRFYIDRTDTENPSVPILLACGTVSTICGQLVSYPLSLVRTRLQAQELPMDSAKRDTMTKLFASIWNKEGVRGLYRGLLPNIIKVVPAVSITYAVYENIKKELVFKPSRAA